MDPVSPPLLTVPALGVRERPGVMVSVALKVRMASLWAACAGRAAQPTNRIKSAAAKTKESRFILSTLRVPGQERAPGRYRGPYPRR